MHFRKFLQKWLETTGTLDVCKPGTAIQTQKIKNCSEAEDRILTKISENQEDLRHSVFELD